ncbi:MAG: peptidase M15, partial [Gammaproteobacteria bacterium]
GLYKPSESLEFHTTLVDQLPPILRLYVGCASVLYGDYRDADLIKIHIRSGKLTIMKFDDFEGKPLPRMIERVKIKLREQEIDYFDYVDNFEPPYRYRKSLYINEEFPCYPEQIVFEEALESLGLFDFSGYGPRPAELKEGLSAHRYELEGFNLVRTTSLPELNDPCGANLRFRDMIECGETQALMGIANIPKRPESFNALFDLAVNILDPVIDYFGMIRLTYGFCSPQLAKKIPNRIDPRRDQHASCELNRKGNAICKRLGAAVDILIEDESMLEVAKWVVANTPFDRLYFYDDDKPIHISFGPNQDRQVVRMMTTKPGRKIPLRSPPAEFLVIKSISYKEQ